MQGCAKRESLEQALRNKLMGEIRRLQHSNIQATKEAEAADQNQQVIIKLLLQSEFINHTTINHITLTVKPLMLVIVFSPNVRYLEIFLQLERSNKRTYSPYLI